MNIEWSPPEPREGFSGYWDRFVGPGATAAETGLSMVAAAAAGVLASLSLRRKEPGYPAWKLALAGLISADLAGGEFTNSSSSGKRWYHREGVGFKRHLAFNAVHAAQILLVSRFYPSMNWRYFGVAYGQLMASTVAVGVTPLYLRRPVAFCMVCASVLTNGYFVDAPEGFEWFMPVLFLKLVAGHLLKEAPFRPGSESSPAC